MPAPTPQPTADAQRQHARDGKQRPDSAGSEPPLELLSVPSPSPNDRNTCFDQWLVTCADGPPSPGVVFTNNIVTYGRYGLAGSGKASGNSVIEFYFPGGVFQRNVFIGMPAEVKPSQYPGGNFFVASADDVKFVDRVGGNYRLAPDSPFRNAGADGKDLGADITLP